MVADVQPGAGGDLRAFLDKTVRQADPRADAERERHARRAEEERDSAARRDAEAKAAEASARSRDEQLERGFRLDLDTSRRPDDAPLQLPAHGEAACRPRATIGASAISDGAIPETSARTSRCAIRTRQRQLAARTSSRDSGSVCAASSDPAHHQRRAVVALRAATSGARLVKNHRRGDHRRARDPLQPGRPR